MPESKCLFSYYVWILVFFFVFSAKMLFCVLFDVFNYSSKELNVLINVDCRLFCIVQYALFLCLLIEVFVLFY